MAYLLKYQMRFERNDGTEEEPNTVEYFQNAAIRATDADYDKQMAFAQAEAYNGEVTVEEVEDEETTDTPTTDTPTAEPSVWDELDAAYREGVNAAYDNQ